MKILKWFVILIIAIPVVFAGGSFIRNKAVGPVGWAEDNTIKALRAQMKDPDSMVIRSSYFVQKVNKDNDTEISMCGIVDGKNGFGGFSGGTRFVSKSLRTKNTFDTHVVKIDSTAPQRKREAAQVHMLTGFEEVYWNGYCVDDAHPPLVPEK